MKLVCPRIMPLNVIIINYHHSMKLYQDILSLLLSVLLRVCSTSKNINGNKRVIFFFSIACYYGDDDFIIQTFNFIAACMTCST